MILLPALVLLPALAALFAYFAPRPRMRDQLLVATALVHLLGSLAAWRAPRQTALGGWLAVDAPGLIVLLVVSLLFAAVAGYTVGFLRRDRPRGARIFVSCLLGFLAAATLVSLAHHLALVWIGMEATTLCVAPLVFHRRDRRSLEAVWKYLVLSSVGIGLALLGTFFLASAQAVGRPLVLEDLVRHADRLQPGLLRGAFVFLLIGYGTKMGLAPLHAWKPDTYGEAPSPVAALMAGALTSCAFLGLVRIAQVMTAAGQASFMRTPLLAFGLASLVVSAAFLVTQTDLKRLLAYSSVEHLGLMVLALALGGLGSYAALLHLVNNGLIKGVTFLAVGNVVLARGSAESAEVRGILRHSPWSGMLLLAGLFAVTGSPPFGLFRSELAILAAAFQSGRAWLALLVLLLLAIIFVGMGRTILEAVLGEPRAARTGPRESAWLLAGPLVLLLAVLLLGVYLPVPLQGLLDQAAGALNGRGP